MESDAMCTLNTNESAPNRINFLNKEDPDPILICPDLEESTPSIFCQFRNCYELSAKEVLINTLYTNGRTEVSMKLCDAHKILMIKYWKDARRALNALWEYTGSNPLTKWNSLTIFHLNNNDVRIIRIVLKYICATFENIIHCYNEPEQPQQILIKCRADVRENIAKCGVLLQIPRRS